LPSSKDNNLTDNKILDSIIYLEGSIGTTLLRNEIINGFIWLRGSVGAESSYNIDTSNTIDGKYLYYYVDERNLNKINFTDAGQVILVNCRNSIIENVSFRHCQHFSLYYCSDIYLNKSVFADSISLYYTESCHVIGNNFTESCVIHLYYSNNNSVSQNFANTSFLHLPIMYSNDNKISDNSFVTEGTPWGIIHLYESDSNELSRNYMQLKNQSYSSYERNGIELGRSHYNSIIENNILNTDISIYLDESSNNVIYGNLINETDIGIYFEYSDYNSITNNILIVRNACFYVSFGSDGNVFANNYCNIPFEQIIPGFLPVLILLCITSISIVFYIYKINTEKDDDGAKK